MAPRHRHTSSRRAQIIAATIDTVAELGYARTTFARIAERGGLSSTRLISYHFASKEDLMRAVIGDVYRSINDHLITRMEVDPATRPIVPPDGSDRLPLPQSAAAELSAYITGVISYIAENRTRLQALQSIFAAVHDQPQNPAVAQVDPVGGVMTYLISVLERGQVNGDFRTFDPQVVAAMIQRPLESLPLLMRSSPDLDLPSYAAEMVTAAHLVTRVGSGDGSPGP